jgi:2-polyprenyl-6-methoxyphenol hydroxylase-like FAD-dependent oxidoreductase
MTAEPVLVAGGGPVGLSTALLLARWGVPSVVLEAAADRDEIGSKAICMQRDVLDVFARIGVADDLVAAGVTWHVGRTYFREVELFETTFPDPGRSAFPPWVNVPQATTERLLWSRVVEEPLIDVRLGQEVVGVAESADGVTVDVRTSSGDVVVHGSHLVGADGSRSRVRRLLGLPFEGHSFDDQFLIADIRASLPFANERRFYFDPPWNPGRQVLVHPQPDSVWRIDWQVPGDYDLAADSASGGLDARVRRIVGASAPYELVWLSAYRFHQRVVPSFRRGRVFLAGDAAHLMSPFGARGLNSGMQDAENLAWKLAYVRHGWAPEALLDSYDVERRAAALENLRVTGATMRFLVPQSSDERALRTAVLERCLTDPAAVAKVDSGKLAEPYWYLDSPLTTPAGSVVDFPTSPGVARPAVPGVLCPDAPVTVAGRPDVRRLRALFGEGFVVLTCALDVGDAEVAGRVDVYDLAAIDVGGVLADALDAHPGTAVVVRPDGHLAAVVSGARELEAAIARATGAPLATRA